MRNSNAMYFLHDAVIIQGGCTKFCPIFGFAPIDHAIDGRVRVFLGIQVTVPHALPFR